MNALGRKDGSKEPLKLLSQEEDKQPSTEDIALTKKANELMTKLKKVIEKKKEKNRLKK